MSRERESKCIVNHEPCLNPHANKNVFDLDLNLIDDSHDILVQPSQSNSERYQEVDRCLDWLAFGPPVPSIISVGVF